MAVSINKKFWNPISNQFSDLTKIVFTSPNISSPAEAGTRSHILPGSDYIGLWYETVDFMYRVNRNQDLPVSGTNYMRDQQLDFGNSIVDFSNDFIDNYVTVSSGVYNNFKINDIVYYNKTNYLKITEKTEYEGNNYIYIEPIFTVFKPNYNGAIRKNTSIKLYWMGLGVYKTDFVDVYVSFDNTDWLLVASNIQNIGYYTVSGDFITETTSNLRFRIQLTSDPSVYKYTDNYLMSVSEGSLSFFSTATDKLNLYWNSNNVYLNESINSYISYNNTDWTLLGAIQNKGSYVLPNSVLTTSGSVFNVKISLTTNSGIFDISDELNLAPVGLNLESTILSGTKFRVYGTTINEVSDYIGIYWSASNLYKNDALDVLLSSDNGTSFNVVGELYNLGYFNLKFCYDTNNINNIKLFNDITYLSSVNKTDELIIRFKLKNSNVYIDLPPIKFFNTTSSGTNYIIDTTQNTMLRGLPYTLWYNMEASTYNKPISLFKDINSSPVISGTNNIGYFNITDTVTSSISGTTNLFTIKQYTNTISKTFNIENVVNNYDNIFNSDSFLTNLYREGNYIYSAGNRLHRLNLTNNVEEIIETYPPLSLDNTSFICVKNNKVYIMYGKSTDIWWEYDLITGNWVELASLPYTYTNRETVYLDHLNETDTFYYFNTAYRELWKYTRSLDSWSLFYKSNDLTSTIGPVFFKLNNYIYLTKSLANSTLSAFTTVSGGPGLSFNGVIDPTWPVSVLSAYVDNNISVLGTKISNTYNVYYSSNTVSGIYQPYAGNPVFSSVSSSKNTMAKTDYGFVIKDDLSSYFKNYTLSGISPVSLPGVSVDGFGGSCLIGDYLYVSQGEHSSNMFKINVNNFDYDIIPISIYNLDATNKSSNKYDSMVTDGSYLYKLKGYNSNKFYKYNTLANEWTVLADLPGPAQQFSKLINVSNKIYMMQGSDSPAFWSYNISTNTWSVLNDIPFTIIDKSFMLYNDYDNCIYILSSSSTYNFIKYDIANSSWGTSRTLTVYVNGGSQRVLNSSKLMFAKFINNYLYAYYWDGSAATCDLMRIDIINNSYVVLKNQLPLFNNKHSLAHYKSSSEVMYYVDQNYGVGYIKIGLIEDIIYNNSNQPLEYTTPSGFVSVSIPSGWGQITQDRPVSTTPSTWLAPTSSPTDLGTPGSWVEPSLSPQRDKIYKFTMKAYSTANPTIVSGTIDTYYWGAGTTSNNTVKDSIVFEITNGEAYNCRLTAWDDDTHSTTNNKILSEGHYRASCLAYRAVGGTKDNPVISGSNSIVHFPETDVVLKGNTSYYGDFNLVYAANLSPQHGDYVIFKPRLYDMNATFLPGSYDFVTTLHYQYT